jgi:hypothetical protein
MAALSTIQTIAEDQTEVASKLETLLVDNSVDSSNIKTLEVAKYGENKFLIQVTY